MKKIIILAMFLGLLGTTANNSFAAYFNNTPIATCDKQINVYLTLGSSGDDVYTLQDLLNRGGYLNATPNGHFGSATKSAVKSFQIDNDISATGSTGPMTRNAINERLCDNDVTANSSYGYFGSNSAYGISTGVTYVDQYDPYVKVISPAVQAPAVYSTLQNSSVSTPAYNIGDYSNPTNLNYMNNSNSISYPVNNNYPIAPATTDTSLTNANIIYNPNIGYTYGLVPNSGSVTITNPTSNTFYNEGDTVNLNWTTNNFNYSQFQVILENTNTGRSQVVNTVSGNSYSFVLTKDLLDYVCGGTCNNYQNYQQGSYRIVLATPYKDIAGNISTFRAAIYPITINRPYAFYGSSSLTSNKSPVNSGEMFKLYVNIPTGAFYNQNLSGVSYLKISTICPSGVTVSIGGLGCGQEFIVPQVALQYQQEIPVMASNNGWFAQGVTFNLTVYNAQGQSSSTASAVVQVNPIARASF